MNRTSRKNALVLALFPVIVTSIGSVGRDIGGALDKILTICLAVIALVVILIVLAFLWWLFGRGGGGRG